MNPSLTVFLKDAIIVNSDFHMFKSEGQSL